MREIWLREVEEVEMVEEGLGYRSYPLHFGFAQ